MHVTVGLEAFAALRRPVEPANVDDRRFREALALRFGSSEWSGMGTETWIAIVGAGISFAAAGIAVWQARLAKDQARTAKDSSVSARRQAEAAEKQVQLMQRQIEGEERNRLDAEKPIFTVEHGEVADDDNSQRCVGLRLTQDKGTSLSNVRVSVVETSVKGIRLVRDSWDALTAIDLGTSADRAVHRLWIALEYNYVDPLQVTVRIEATARDSGASWSSERVIFPTQLPPEPRAQTGRMRRPTGRGAFTP
ncbi:hypothetical protein [Kitasatospora indigofera]|uniref:hypothetical protein n=1 Tax=Kitasatospora indigofera TaxID=67307 RepID=UPI0036979289